MANTKWPVLFVIPTPPPYSGPEIMGELLLRVGLSSNFHIHHLRTNVNLSNKGKGKFNFTKLSAFAAIWMRLILAILRYRPRIVYLYLSPNRSGFFRDAIIAVTANILGTKVIGHIHGSNFQYFYEHSNQICRRFICQALSRFSCIILLAEKFRSQFDGLVPEQRIHVVYNVVDTHLFKKKGEQSFPLSDNAMTVLFIGHLSTAKGFFDLLKVAPQVLEAVPNLEFAFAGEWLSTENNILYDEAGHLIKHDNMAIRSLWTELLRRYDGRVRYLGVLSRPALATAIKTAHIFVLPSHSEGFPIAVLEAMAGGLPLVVTPVGALPEVLEDGVNAVFVSPGDIDALAKALIELACQPEKRIQMGLVNRKLVETAFTPEVMRRRIAEIFGQYAA